MVKIKWRKKRKPSKPNPAIVSVDRLLQTKKNGTKMTPPPSKLKGKREFQENRK